jgi:Leishmanolysin
LVLFVTGLDTSYCDGGTIAYASSWSKDQFDRPVFGQINLCPSALANMRTGDFEAGLGVIMHEMTHVMVMDSSLFPLWRYKDNNATPRTPRDPLYPFLPGELTDRDHSCPAAAQHATKGSTSSFLPSFNLLSCSSTIQPRLLLRRAAFPIVHPCQQHLAVV